LREISDNFMCVFGENLKSSMDHHIVPI